MARILCGVMGDAMGHVNEALALAQALPGHEFLFLGGGQVARLGQAGYRVEPLPLLGTAYNANRVAVAATIGQGARALTGLAQTLAKVERVIRRFRPDLALSLYEVFTLLAAGRLGLACLSLNHQHFLDRCHPPPIQGQATARLLLRLSLASFCGLARRCLVPSFFPLRPRDPRRTQVFPPLLSPGLAELRPTQGEHAVVYQTSATFRRLLPALRQWGRPCVIYGLGRRPACGNLVFRAPDRRRFLEDLASCRFLVANGGHTAISEALYLGKPVLSFPIALAFEQYANACMLRRLGYGDFSLNPSPQAHLLRSFETRLEQFSAAMAGGDFHGTARLAGRLEQLLKRG
ncbi:MAG: hypothetical protein C0405_12510 [Desulfovibrio sp.]|nr:hypothetical protein [Desulfovibrio sp.]